MGDPREPQDPNSPWARPGQPSSDPAQQAYQPQQFPEQQWPEQQPDQQQGPRQQQWQQPPGQGWQAGSYPQDQSYQSVQPYSNQWTQPGQQYYPGQPYAGGPQQGYGEVPPTPTGTAKRSRAPLFVALAVLVVVVIGAAAAFFLTSRSTLDRQAAEVGVAQVLTTSYGLEHVTDVKCPSGQKVRKDDTFTCTVRIDGENRDVIITFVDDDGTYEVGRPN